MSFALNNSGVGCYSLVFKGEHIGAVFAADEPERDEPWIALIHDAWARGRALPRPFTTRQHRFRSLHELKRWLGLGPAAPEKRTRVA